MSARPPGMSPVTNGCATLRHGLMSLCVAAAVSASGLAGEDRAASPSDADKVSSPATTSGTTETAKTPAANADSTPAKQPVPTPPVEANPRIAVVEKKSAPRSASNPESNSSTPENPIQRAIKIVAQCQDRYTSVSDYTCTLFKRERISGKLIPAHIMAMKVRTKPQSIYLRFQQPAKWARGDLHRRPARRQGPRARRRVQQAARRHPRLEPTSSRAMDRLSASDHRSRDRAAARYRVQTLGSRTQSERNRRKICRYARRRTALCHGRIDPSQKELAISCSIGSVCTSIRSWASPSASKPTTGRSTRRRARARRGIHLQRPEAQRRTLRPRLRRRQCRILVWPLLNRTASEFKKAQFGPEPCR